MYKSCQANFHIMNMLKEHIQRQSTFTHNNKVYNLLIEDLEMAYLSLTLNHDKDKIVIYLCLDDTNAISISTSYMSNNIDENNHMIKDYKDTDFFYNENVICPTNDTETILFIFDLFNVFLVDILNNKYIKSIHKDVDDVIFT